MSKDKKYKVFIVDDDEFLLDMYTIKFRAEGIDVTPCNGPNAVLDKLREGVEPDLILLDIIMPEMDGFDVLEAIKKEKLVKKAKIVILSNQGQDDHIDRARELGAVGYIVKASAIPSEVLKKALEILES